MKKILGIAISILFTLSSAQARVNIYTPEEAKAKQQLQLDEAKNISAQLSELAKNSTDKALKAKLSDLRRQLDSARYDYSQSEAPRNSPTFVNTGRNPEEKIMIQALTEAKWYLRTEEEIQKENESRFRDLDKLRERLNALNLDERRKQIILDDIDNLQKTNAVTRVSYEEHSRFSSLYATIAEEIELYEGQRDPRPNIKRPKIGHTGE